MKFFPTKTETLLKRSQDAISAFENTKQNLLKTNEAIENEQVILQEQVQQIQQQVSSLEETKIKNKNIVDKISVLLS